MTVRLDKWLTVARVFKTRSQASRACTLGRVKVNDERAKPHRSLAVGDTIAVARTQGERLLIVQVLHDRPMKKAEASSLYEDRSPPPVLDPVARLLRRAPVVRERGAGRPTKRDRRRLEQATRDD